MWIGQMYIRDNSLLWFALALWKNTSVFTNQVVVSVLKQKREILFANVLINKYSPKRMIVIW